MENPSDHRRRGRPRQSQASEPAAINQALDRGLQLLEQLAAEEHPQTLSNLSIDTGIAASTLYRLLITLQRRGLVEFDSASQTWSIGIEAFRIGSAFRRRMNYLEASRQTMRELMTQTGETCNLGVLDGDDVVFLSQVETHHPIRAFFRPGTRGPLHASGIGKMLLAQLPDNTIQAWTKNHALAQLTDKTIICPLALVEELTKIKLRGWSLDDEESTLGMRCLAAPIFNEYGEAVAGVSISGPVTRINDTVLPQLAKQVCNAAGQITKAIGGVNY